MDWLRSEDLNEEKNVTTPMVILAFHALCRWQEWQSVPLGMQAMKSEYLDPDLSDRSVSADILVREEPEEDEEEDENERDDKERR